MLPQTDSQGPWPRLQHLAGGLVHCFWGLGTQSTARFGGGGGVWGMLKAFWGSPGTLQPPADIRAGPYLERRSYQGLGYDEPLPRHIP